MTRWKYQLTPRADVEPVAPPTTDEAVAAWLRELAAVGWQPGPGLIASTGAQRILELQLLGLLDLDAGIALEDGSVLLNPPTVIADTFTTAAAALELRSVEFSWRDLADQRPDYATIAAWRAEQDKPGIRGRYLWPDRKWSKPAQLDLGPAPLGPWYSAPTLEVGSFEVVGRQLRYSADLSAGTAWAEKVLDRLQRLATTATEARRRAATLVEVCANPDASMGPTRTDQKATVLQRGTTRGVYDATLDLITFAAQELWLGLRQTEQVVLAQIPTARPAIRSLGVFSK